MAYKVRSSWPELVKAFRLADKAQSGSLSTADLRAILHRFAIDLAPKQFAQLLLEATFPAHGSLQWFFDRSVYKTNQMRSYMFGTVWKGNKTIHAIL